MKEEKERKKKEERIKSYINYIWYIILGIIILLIFINDDREQSWHYLKIGIIVLLVQCKNLGDIDSIVQKWNLDHNENASWRMYITHEGDSLCIVQKNGYKIQAQILVNH